MKEQDEFLTALGARLKAARVNRNNMSQRELAELAGTAKGSISSYELGASEAGIKSLTKNSRHFERVRFLADKRKRNY